MFNKYAANDITRLYFEKYTELKRLQSDPKNLDNILPPLNIYVEPTNRCNMNCVFCARENSTRELMMLTFENFKKCIDSLPKGSYVSLLGNGEPTLNPHIYEMIQYASESGMHVSMTTNASTFTEINRMKLMNSGLSRLQISFQSINPYIYENVMRNAKFKNTLTNILELIKAIRINNKSIYISISIVKIDDNETDYKLSNSFWSKMPVDNIYFGPLLSVQTDSKLADKVEVSSTYCPCANPFISAKINADGTVNFCALDFSSKYVVGNIKEQSFMEIANSEKTRALRRAVLEGDMEFLDKIGYHCGKCNTWTKSVGGSIAGVLENSLPVRLGLVINELSCDRSKDISFLDRVLEALKSGETDLVGCFGGELTDD